MFHLRKDSSICDDAGNQSISQKVNIHIDSSSVQSEGVVFTPDRSDTSPYAHSSQQP